MSKLSRTLILVATLLLACCAGTAFAADDKAACTPIAIDLTEDGVVETMNGAESISENYTSESYESDGTKISISESWMRTADGNLIGTTTTCTSSCTGNGCSINGCDASTFGCSSCSCWGIGCSSCTCTKKSVHNEE